MMTIIRLLLGVCVGIAAAYMSAMWSPSETASALAFMFVGACILADDIESLLNPPASIKTIKLPADLKWLSI